MRPGNDVALNIQALGARWRSALDAAESAIRAASGYLSRQ